MTTLYAKYTGQRLSPINTACGSKIFMFLTSILISTEITFAMSTGYKDCSLKTLSIMTRTSDFRGQEIGWVS